MVATMGPMTQNFVAHWEPWIFRKMFNYSALNSRIMVQFYSGTGFSSLYWFSINMH